MKIAGDTPMNFATLFGWPSAKERPLAGGIEVLGVPSDSGNGIASGARFGPEAIRRASLKLRPNAIGIDHGDIDGVHGYDWADVLEQTERAVEGIAKRKSLPIVLGGDHAISYAAVAALRGHRPLNIVWFDAHTDFCAWPGGRWHNHKQVLRRIAGLEHVGRILQIGHRGITYSDETRRSEKMTVVTAGAAPRLQAQSILDCLPPGQPVYISVDIDAVDPRWAPGTGHPVPGGLSAMLLSDLARTVASNRHVAGLDVMEVNPLLDHQDITSAAAAGIVSEIVSALPVRDEIAEIRAV